LSVPFSSFATQAGAILGGYLINQQDGASYMNGAMWSLSVEFQFYAAFAVAALAAVSLRASPRLIGSATQGSYRIVSHRP
jgi:peptidoglycan/LPS O-acetylase OafA/YrhL